MPKRVAVAVAALAAACTLAACGGGDDDPDGAAVSELAERVVADLELPGDPEPPIDPAEIPDGELEFGFHCHIRGAGLEIDDVLVAFPPAKVWHEEHPGGEVEQLDVAILTFDTAGSAAEVLAAYDDADTLDCLSRTFGDEVGLAPAEPLEVDGRTATGFAVTIGTGEVQADGHRTFALTVGQHLVDVTVLAPSEERRRTLASTTLADVIDALEAGGA